MHLVRKAAVAEEPCYDLGLETDAGLPHPAQAQCEAQGFAAVLSSLLDRLVGFPFIARGKTNDGSVLSVPPAAELP